LQKPGPVNPIVNHFETMNPAKLAGSGEFRAAE
jgi:hypothetical protein